MNPPQVHALHNPINGTVEGAPLSPPPILGTQPPAVDLSLSNSTPSYLSQLSSASTSFSMANPAAAAGLLARQLKQMQTDKDIPGISVGLTEKENIFEWEVMLMVGEECEFYGGG